MQAAYLSTFSGIHTYKCEPAGEIRFNNLFCLTQDIQNSAILTHSPYKTVTSCLAFFVCPKSERSSVCLTLTPAFRLATLQALGSTCGQRLPCWESQL